LPRAPISKQRAVARKHALPVSHSEIRSRPATEAIQFFSSQDISNRGSAALLDQDGRIIRQLSKEEIDTLLIGGSLEQLTVDDNEILIITTDGVRFSLRVNEGRRKRGVYLTRYVSVDQTKFHKYDFGLVGDGIDASLSLVERRLDALRELYAITYFIDQGVQEASLKRLLDDVSFDSTIRVEDQLYVEGASSGSFWLGVVAKSKAAYETIKSGLLLLIPEGRSALLRRIRAETESRELDVKSKELKVEKEEVDLKKHQINLVTQQTNAMITLSNKINKIKDPELRQAVRKRVASGFRELGINTTPIVGQIEHEAGRLASRATDVDASDEPKPGQTAAL
jgi:hypothetical protein